MTRPVWAHGLFVLALALPMACAPARPPFTQAVTRDALPDASKATLAFLWPSTSCDTGGYYSLATADGKFVGNLSSGTQLRVSMPPGEHTIFGWSDARAPGDASVVGLPVLSATLDAGRTYYVRMAFGEWDETGPREMHMRRTAQRVCYRIGNVMSAAMNILTPSSDLWTEMPGWVSELPALAPDAAGGQAWLDANHDVVAARRDLAVGRLAGLRPLARRLSTLHAVDGVVPAP